MSELRKDPVIGRWVIISTERARRPHDFAAAAVPFTEKPCPFCAGKEHDTPPEIFSMRASSSKPNQPGCDIRVIPSIAPVLKVEGKLNRRGKGMYDMIDGIGAHEVIVETPSHISDISMLDEVQIAKVITTYIERINDLQKDARLKYVLIFKNHGVTAGAGVIRHARSQLIAMPINPKRVKEELVGAKKYFEYKERCIFCDIIKQELEIKKRIVHDSDGFIAITPFASRFPFEIWILPKEHSPDFASISPEQRINLGKMLKVTLGKLKKALNDPPYNYIIHTSPFRRFTKAGYWRTIDEDYHWHIEIMPRLTRVAGFEWGSGFFLNQPRRGVQ